MLVGNKEKNEKTLPFATNIFDRLLIWMDWLCPAVSTLPPVVAPGSAAAKQTAAAQWRRRRRSPMTKQASCHAYFKREG
jgi:hypothetical protein